jgi:acetylornithine deacetylase/succinyl-diaminopimelate desuccinylase-like protein
VAVGHKGRRGATITAAGESAHASEVGRGENAIYRACDAVDVLRSLRVPETSVLGHELAGSLTATEISGGTAWNVVPDVCTVTVDERIDRLVQKRQNFLESAIPPLERARKLAEDPYLQLDGKQQLREDACRALLVAYVQTQRSNKAAQVEGCTGLASSARE